MADTPGLRWSSTDRTAQPISAFDPAGFFVGEVVRYTGWMAFLRQERVDGVQYDTPAVAQAVVEQAWLQRAIADLDAEG